MKYTKYYSLIFPILIFLIGGFIYKILEFEPNFFTIITNIGIAFILLPRVKTLNAQTGRRVQVTWLFYKKSKIIN